MIKKILDIHIEDSKNKRMRNEKRKELILQIHEQLLPELTIIAEKMGSLNVESFTKTVVPHLMDILKEEVLIEAGAGNKQLTDEVVNKYRELLECQDKETVYID